MSGFGEPQTSCVKQTVLVFYTFVRSWVISLADPLANEINQGPYNINAGRPPLTRFSNNTVYFGTTLICQY